MFPYLMQVVARLRGRRGPWNPPPDPYAAVRQPRGREPGGRHASAAVAEPEPRRSTDAVAAPRRRRSPAEAPLNRS